MNRQKRCTSRAPVIVLIAGFFYASVILVSESPAATGEAKSHQKISSTDGGFTGVLDDSDRFGHSAANIGDLDGDGVTDLAVGGWLDDDGGYNRGALWILFLHSDGMVKSHQKISSTHGGFTGLLDDWDVFGGSVCEMGDLDNDSVTDLAVGAYGDDDGGDYHGAVWILFLNGDGTVRSHQKISETQGGFTGELSNMDRFGFSLAWQRPRRRVDSFPQRQRHGQVASKDQLHSRRFQRGAG
jgi:hypothetical protein